MSMYNSLPFTREAVETVKKASQSSLPAGSEEREMMFSGGVYVGEHTPQAASVGRVRFWRT